MSSCVRSHLKDRESWKGESFAACHQRALRLLLELQTRKKRGLKSFQISQSSIAKQHLMFAAVAAPNTGTLARPAIPL
eukprot:1146692-Pelagomonas_calceolata.AAC.1